MAQSDTGRESLDHRMVDTLGCTPRSGVHTVSEPPASTDFDEKVLDEGQLRLHLAELERLGTGLDVTLKSDPVSSARMVPLMDLVRPLVKSEAFGGQIQYTIAGHRWLDTLISTQTGVRLVRIRLTA